MPDQRHTDLKRIYDTDIPCTDPECLALPIEQWAMYRCGACGNAMCHWHRDHGACQSGPPGDALDLTGCADEAAAAFAAWIYLNRPGFAAEGAARKLAFAAIVHDFLVDFPDRISDDTAISGSRIQSGFRRAERSLHPAAGDGPDERQ